MKFKPIKDAPISMNGSDQILCRFWYPHIKGHWVYFIAVPNGARTQTAGYAAPEEWCELPQGKE